MKHLFAIVLTMGCAIGGAASFAQVPPRAPDVEIRIPAPQPVPPGPVIDGPATQGAPPPLNTYSDRMTQCLNQGSRAGLSGADLDGYARACAAKEN
jgi:hypothetical protein